MSARTSEWLEEVIASGESESVEFKVSVPPEHQIAAHLSAFANASGGTLILGVADQGEVRGLTPAEVSDAEGRLVRISSSLLSTPVEVGYWSLHGRTVVFAHVDAVPPHLRPVATSTGDVFVRHGTRSERVPAGRAFAAERETIATSLQRPVKVFVAMSFRTEEEPALVDYFRAMQRAARATGLPITLTRIDLVDGDYEISQRIMAEIKSCDLVLADFTLSPRNVYFEVGYARGCEKPVIQVARKDTQLEFDTRNWRTHFYRNATELEERLEQALAAAYAEAVRAV